MNMGNVKMAPPAGWAKFTDSKALTDWLWATCSGWHYLNPTSLTSIWENRDDASHVYVEFDSADSIVDLVVSRTTAAGAALVLNQLEREFGLVVLPDIDAD